VHDRPVVVGHPKPIGATLVGLVKIALVAFFDVSPHNTDVIVPFPPILFVDEAQRVHQLVHRGANLGGAMGTLQVHFLPPFYPAHARPASRVAVHDRHVVRIGRCPRPEPAKQFLTVGSMTNVKSRRSLDASVFVIDLHGPLDHLHVFGRVERRDLVGHHPFLPPRRFGNQPVSSLFGEQDVPLEVLPQFFGVLG
jgi:hypothetical protein